MKSFFIKNLKFISVFSTIILMVGFVYATSVSDIDMSAFISKVEFESIKNDYQMKINSYNANLDSKIDIAISNYIAGIKADTTPKNYFEIYKGGNGGSPIFYWDLPGIGVEDHPAKVDLFFDKEFAYNVYSTIKYSGYYWYYDPNAAIDGGIIFGNDPNWAGANSGWTNLWYRHDPRPKTQADTNSNRLVNFSLNYVHNAWKESTSRPAEVRVKKITNNEFLEPNVAPVWTILSDNGKNSLYMYQLNTCPYLVLNVHRHVYKDFASLSTEFYMTNGGKKEYDTEKTTVNLITSVDYGEKSEGEEYTGTSNQIGNYIRQNLQKMEINNNVDYRMAVFPISNDSIWCLPTTPQVNLDDTETTQTIDDQYWYDIYWRTMIGGEMQTNTLYGMHLNYKRPYFKATEYPVKSFEIPSISSMMGENIYHGDGFPILRSESDDTDVKITIKLKNDLNDSSNVTCLFSNKKLQGANFDVSANIQLTKDIACNTDVDFEIRNLDKNDIIWMNPVSGMGEYVYIDSITIKKLSD